MAPTVTQIRSDIETTKSQIASTVNELEMRLDEMRDLGSVINRYPLASLAVSVGVGVLLSGFLTAKLVHTGKRYAGHLFTTTISAYLLQKAQQKNTLYR